MKLKIWEISLMMAVVIAVLWGVLLGSDQSELSGKLIRLHVVANSDEREDQEVKLMVRDAVLEEVDKILEGGENKNEACEKIGNNLTSIRRAAEETLAEQNVMNPVNVSLEKEHYPTRDYESFSLPAGNYTSLKVSIGRAEGRNWWCVVFPPLCVEAAEGGVSGAGRAMKTSGLTDDEVALITEDNTGYLIRFKALEILDSLKEALR